MNPTRRDILRGALQGGALALGGSLFGWASPALAGTTVSRLWPRPSDKRLLHLMLRGGADLRGLIAPEPDDLPDSYGDRFYGARAPLYAAAGTLAAAKAEVRAKWLAARDSLGNPIRFHPQAGWLWEEYQAGRVAVVANIRQPTSRNHDLCQNAYEAGDLALSSSQTPQSGWGGRLLDELQQQAPQASLIHTGTRISAFGWAQSASPETLICLPDSRDPGFGTPQGPKGLALQEALDRYYVDARQPGDARQVTRQHFQQISKLSADLQGGLQGVAIPSALSRAVGDEGIWRQALSVYDSLACDSLLGGRVLCMEQEGFDTHKNQRGTLEAQWEELFGARGVMAALDKSLVSDLPRERQSLILAIGSDFGRQLRANGDAGSDHGGASSVILWAPRDLRGGTYGELFPSGEDFRTPGTEIEGLTDWQYAYGQAADEVAGRSIGASLFPNSAPICEDPNLIGALFA